MVALGKPGRLAEIRKNDLLIPEYQREVDWPRIRKMAKEFDWFLFGVLYVSYRSPDYYVVDGRHRLEAARMLTDIDMLPCMAFDFEGPQHEAEIFVMLQRNRKPLVTRDMHAAELFAGGQFGAVAKAAEDFIDGLECESVPLASIRKLVAVKPDAFDRVAPLIAPLVGPQALAKDFIEAIVYLEDATGLPLERQDRLMEMGYERLLSGMMAYQAGHMDGRLAKIASPRQKADALRWAIDGNDPIDYGITRTDVAAGE